MNKTIYRFICAIVAFALTIGSYVSASALVISPNTYYVSVTGNDANACTSTAPCKTFTRAMSLAQPGDTVRVLQGIYNQQLVISKSSIILEGDRAVINTPTVRNGIVVTSTAQNVTVKGFTVTGTISHVIFVQGKFITVENNIVHDAITENGTYPNCGSSRWGSGIKLEKGSSDVIVRGNEVYRVCGEGIASTMSFNVLIENNVIHDNHAVNIYIDNSHNVEVLNNNVYCTKTTDNPAGIALGEESYSGWGAQLKDVIISGNDVTNCSTGVAAFTSNVGGTLTNVTISNNFIPSGQSKGVSLDNSKNLNVSIINNTYYNQPWIRSTAGVTLSGNVVGTSEVATSLLVNSVLPTSRSVTAGTTATIFNTVINAGANPVSGVTLSINPAPAGTFVYQQTDCATNAIIGSPNPSLDLASGGVLCYVLSFTPSATFAATNVHIRAQASNAPSTTLLTGINTWLLRSTSVAGPDIVALTTTTDFHQVACSGTNAFAVALSNVGVAATSDITAVANTGTATLPVSISISETDPGTGAIIGDHVLQSVGAGENRTVAVFVAFNGCISFDSAVNRIFIEFRDASNNVVGSTSTAVSTNR